MEAEKAQQQAEELENALKKALHLLLKLLRDERLRQQGRWQQHSQNVQCFNASLQKAKPEVRTEIVEKEVLSDAAKAALQVARKQIAVIQAENEVLQEQVQAGIEATTHFSNLEAEVDRLKIEEQDLLNRIEELKQPRRNTSSCVSTPSRQTD